MKTRIIMQVVMLAASMAVLVGCGKEIPPPDEQMTLAGAAVAKAESAEAYRHAPVEFSSARAKLNEAQKLVEKEEYVEARRLAEEAEVDANLAFIKSRSATAQEAVAELQKTLRTLQEEMQRIQAQ
jgi:NADH:ubiquinone oxidoreductase subunit D